jgi:ABC-type transport system involved in cytochrome bd biosynthesis fused ATPase/permease subunit
MNQENPTETKSDVVREESEASKAEGLPPDVAPAFERMERLLRQIRGALDTTAREAKYRDFSALRLVGAILQVFVVGLVVMALLDWIFAASAGSLLIKLAFATVLQLSALTAFVVSRQRR